MAIIVPMKCTSCSYEFDTSRMSPPNGSYSQEAEISHCSVSCRRPGCSGSAYQTVHPTFAIDGHGKAILVRAEKPDGIGDLLFDRGVKAIRRALRRRTPDAEDAFITEYLSGKYEVIGTAIGDLAVGEPNSPALRWREDIESDSRAPEGPLLEFAEKASVLAEAAVTQHLKLLARAYWDNLGNPDAEDPADWPAEAIYPPARATLEGAAIIGWLLRPNVEGFERVQRICEYMLFTSKKYQQFVTDAGVSTGKNVNGVICVDRGTGPKALNWRRMILDVFDEQIYSIHQEWSKFSHNDPIISSRSNRFVPIEGELFRLTRDVNEDMPVHIDIAGTIAYAVGLSESRKSTYFGRPTFELGEACQAVLDQCRVGSAIARSALRQSGQI